MTPVRSYFVLLQRNSANDGFDSQDLRYPIRLLLVHKRETVFSHGLPPPMNNVPFFILFLQICFTLELGGIPTGGDDSHGVELIKMKSGKIFLRRSSNEKIWPTKDTVEENGHDDDIKVQ